LNAQMDIPSKLDGIREEDLPILIKRALAEVNPAYPVPVIFNARQMDEIFHSVMR
jgi:alcohol dehydrogenase